MVDHLCGIAVLRILYTFVELSVSSFSIISKCTQSIDKSIDATCVDEEIDKLGLLGAFIGIVLGAFFRILLLQPVSFFLVFLIREVIVFIGTGVSLQ